MLNVKNRLESTRWKATLRLLSAVTGEKYSLARRRMFNHGYPHRVWSPLFFAVCIMEHKYPRADPYTLAEHAKSLIDPDLQIDVPATPAAALQVTAENIRRTKNDLDCVNKDLSKMTLALEIHTQNIAHGAKHLEALRRANRRRRRRATEIILTTIKREVIKDLDLDENYMNDPRIERLALQRTKALDGFDDQVTAIADSIKKGKAGFGYD